MGVIDLDSGHTRREIASKRRKDFGIFLRCAGQNDTRWCEQIAQTQLEAHTAQRRCARIGGLGCLGPRRDDLFAGYLDGFCDAGPPLGQPRIVGWIDRRGGQRVDNVLAQCGRAQETEQAKNRICKQAATGQPKLPPDGWIRPFISADWTPS